MSGLKLWVVFCILQASSVQHALGQRPKPIMELYAPDPNNTIIRSDCNDGLVNDVDYFTVRGKVNKNGSNPNAYTDTNLYLQAVKDPSTNAWASQCRPDLTLCSPNLTTDCFCERKDPNGDYHIVMTIMAKSIYSGGSLMLSWNDKRSPYNQPVTSDIVDYYPGPIWDPVQENVTLEVMRTIGVVGNTSFDDNKSLTLDYKPEITNLTFCVYNLEAIGFIKIEMDGTVRANTMTEECVTLDINEEYENQELNMSYVESGGCNRTDSYTLHLKSKAQPIMELYDFVLDPKNINKNSDCINGLVNDVDYFTVRGKVNKNGADPNAYIDTNLYLQAVKDPSTNAWASQCRPDLTVCNSSLTEDCYCERKDPNGDYHIVMTIMAKSIYSNGSLMLSWNDKRSPHNSPILSNIVGYYPGPIWNSNQINVTLEISTAEKVYEVETRYDVFKYDPEKEPRNVTFCVHNLNAVGFILIKMGGTALVNSRTDECVTMDLDKEKQNWTLTLSFEESGGCERKGTYVLHIEPNVTTTTAPQSTTTPGSTTVIPTPTTTTNGSTTVTPTPTTATNGTTSKPDKQVIEPWIIVVSSLGGIIVVAIVITAIIYCLRQNKKKRQPSPQPAPTLSPKDQHEHYDNQHEHHYNQNEGYDNQNENHYNQYERYDNQHEHNGNSVPMKSLVVSTK